MGKPIKSLDKLDARRWPLGHMAVMRDCHGKARTKGQVVERNAYSVTLRLRDGTYIFGGTSLLEEPTGLPWPYENDDKHKAFSWSWDMKVVKALRRGLPEPVFKPWVRPKESARAVTRSDGEQLSRPASSDPKEAKRERARQRRLARKARGGK